MSVALANSREDQSDVHVLQSAALAFPIDAVASFPGRRGKFPGMWEFCMRNCLYLLFGTFNHQTSCMVSFIMQILLIKN